MNQILNIEPKLNWKLFIPVAIIPLLLINSTEVILISIATLICVLLFVKFGNSFLLTLIITSFLLITYKISPTLRLAVQMLNSIILVLLFFKHFGLIFSKYPKIPKELVAYIIIFILLMTISTLISSHTFLGLEKIITQILFFFLLYFLYSSINSEQRVYILLIGLFLSSLISLLILFWQSMSVNFNLFLIYETLFTRESYLGKNNLPILFAISIIFLTVSLFTRYTRVKKIAIFFLVIFMIGVLITDSRASILCLSISIGVILYKLNKKILYSGLLFSACLITFISTTPLFDEILLFLRIDNIGTGRDFLIQATFEVIKKYFWFGAGPAGTKLELYSNLPFMLNSPGEWMISRVYYIGDIGQAHNFYLFLFSDLGIGGLILSLLLPLIYFTYCNRLLRLIKDKKNDDFYIVFGLLGSGIFFFSRGLFEQMNILSYGAIYYDLPFWILFIILVFYYMKYSKYANGK